MINTTIIISFQLQVFSLTELDMEEIINTKGMDQIISGIEKIHKCFIEKSIQPEIIEKTDGSLEFTLGDRNLTVQIACSDIHNETTDVFMHITTEDYFFASNTLLHWGDVSVKQECKAFGQPAPFSIQYTNSEILNVRQIAHVITQGWSEGDLRKCLEAFFDDVSQRNITSVSVSVSWTGPYGYFGQTSAAVIFDSLLTIVESTNALCLIRIVIRDQPRFPFFKDKTIAYFSSKVNRSLNTHLVDLGKFLNLPHSEERAGINEAIFKIYSDDVANIENAWETLKRIARQIIRTKKKIISVDNDTLLARNFENLRKLEKYFGFKFKMIKSGSQRLTFLVRKNTVDFSSAQEICNILEAAEDDDSKGTVLHTQINLYVSKNQKWHLCGFSLRLLS